jgi:hypothetical protein
MVADLNGVIPMSHANDPSPPLVCVPKAIPNDSYVKYDIFIVR